MARSMHHQLTRTEILSKTRLDQIEPYLIQQLSFIHTTPHSLIHSPLPNLRTARTLAMAMSLQFCRISTSSRPEILTGNRPIKIRKALGVRCSGEAPPSGTSSVAVESDFDAKVFRKKLTRSKNYNRRGFGHKEETLELMNQEYTSAFNFRIFVVNFQCLLFC